MSAPAVCVAGAQSVRLDFPLQGESGVPPGFSAMPTESPDRAGRIELPLRGLAPETSLFATFVFEERDGDAIIVTWVPDGEVRPRVLASNLCEGVRGWNQRTIRVPAELSEEAGKIVIDAGGAHPLMRTIVLRWLSPQEVFVDGLTSQARLVNVDGGVLSDDQVDGESFLSPPDAWFGNVAEAYWHSGIEEMNETLQFDVSIERRPDAAVLRVEMLGLPSGIGARVWVNEQFVGTLVPATSDLRDPGYFRDTDGTIRYAGWRKAALFVDSALLSDGNTSVVIESLPGSVFLKNVALQLMFERSNYALEPTVVTGSDLMETPSIGKP